MSLNVNQQTNQETEREIV